MGRTGHEEEPMLGEGPTLFVQSERRRSQDQAWGWLFILSVAVSLAGGAYAFAHRNPDFSRLASPQYLADAAHCPAEAGGPSRRLLGDEEDFQPTLFLEAAGLCTALSVAGGLALGLLALYLVRARPHAMVGAAVALQVLLPASLGVAVLAAGGGGAAVPPLLAAGLLGFVFYLYREQLALVGRLLGIAAHALVDNGTAIVGGSLLVQFGGLLVSLPLLAGLLLAYTNGGVAPNPSAASQSGSVCLDADSREVLCCAWVPDGWAAGYMAWTAVVVGWVSLLAFTTKVFVISGVTAQWYFAPASLGRAPRGSLRRALGHAFGPSFGSLCLASWLLNLLQVLKSAAQSARQDSPDNLLAQVLLSCFEFLLSLLEAVTKFAVVRMAITGEALFDSCRSTADLLARNLLDAVGVWWFPAMVLQVTALLLSAAWGGAAGAAAYGVWAGGAAAGAAAHKAAATSAVALGALAFLMGLLTVSFVNSILLNIVDAVYICFAMDRDAHACTRLEVHEVYALLPSNKAPPGGVVEQPDGGWAFGAAPAQGGEPAHFPPPAARAGASPPGNYPAVPHV